MSSRIGKGPWARALGALLVPDDTTPEAIRGEELWRRGAVEDLRIDVGQIAARVAECAVTITAPTIRPRIWEAVTSYARDRGPLAQALRGEIQSMQLEHLLAQDWEAPLIPFAGSVASCGCDGRSDCEHVVAVAHAIAQAIDREPAALLRWRGFIGRPLDGQSGHADLERSAAHASEPWVGGRPSVPLGRGAGGSVAKRLGPSGIRVGDRDLVDLLTSAYEAFATNSSG